MRSILDSDDFWGNKIEECIIRPPIQRDFFFLYIPSSFGAKNKLNISVDLIVGGHKPVRVQALLHSLVDVSYSIEFDFVRLTTPG